MGGSLDPVAGEAADSFSIETYGEFEPAVRREWLLTNGLGGYAHGTVADVATRRYHATLVAAAAPPAERKVMLSRWGAVLSDGDKTFDLWGAIYRYGLSGDGPSLLRRFRTDGETCEWEYDCDGIKVFKRLFLCWHRNITAVRWFVKVPDWRETKQVRLTLQPFLAMRRHHDLRQAASDEPELRLGEHDATLVTMDDLTASIRVTDDDGEDVALNEQPDWWYGQTYRIEAARGGDDREDVFTPGTFGVDLPTEDGGVVTAWAGLDEMPLLDWTAERRRRKENVQLKPMPTRTQRNLLRAASGFIAKRRRPDGAPGTTILAGMPWLRDWGRDTFIALPGLLLSAERYHLAGQVLSLFASHVNDGMVPSKFAINPAEPIYDAVDPSLWFIHAAHEYLRASKDQETFDAILKDACHEIVDGFTRGTRLGIHVDPEDDLLSAGSQDSALTWMDARAEDGTPHTSRDGKAVEINALWYHALCLVGDDRSERVAKHFNDAFVLPGRGLADVVRGGPGRYERDETIRPNQIFAVSLRHSPLERATQHVVTDVVRRSLLTPYGLRTLDRHDERYKPTVIGNPLERSRAAHDGAVWPWLIGPFLDAHLRIHDGSAASRERARTWLRPLIDHLDTGLVETGLIGYLPEVFDGQYPYLPGGCFGQAWSVAEVFRLAIELDL